MNALAVIKTALRSQEALILIMNDAVAKKVAVAWKIYAPRFADSELRTKGDVQTQLARLWEEVGPIDMNRLAEIAGVPVTRTVKAFARLRAANLIWPDGSMSEEARRIIIGDVGAYILPMIPKTQDRAKGTIDDGKRTDAQDQKVNRKSRIA